MWKKISGKIVPTVLAWDREHINVNLKNSYLTLWMYEEQTRYFVIFHTYLFVLIYIEDLGQVLVFLFFIIYGSNTYSANLLLNTVFRFYL